MDCVRTACEQDNSHGFFCTAITWSKNIKVRAHGRTEVFLIFAVSCSKSVYVCMNVQTHKKERRKKKTRNLKISWRRYAEDSNFTFAKLFLMWRRRWFFKLCAHNQGGVANRREWCGNKTFKHPKSSHERHVPSPCVMTPCLPLLQLHPLGYKSLPSVSHWTRSSTNWFLWLRTDLGKSEVISRLKCSVCSDLKR